MKAVLGAVLLFLVLSGGVSASPLVQPTVTMFARVGPLGKLIGGNGALSVRGDVQGSAWDVRFSRSVEKCAIVAQASGVDNGNRQASVAHAISDDTVQVVMFNDNGNPGNSAVDVIVVCKA